MDTDMVFPKGALAKLIRSQAEIAQDPQWKDVPTIVGGLYVTRSDHRQNAYDWVENKNSFVVNPLEPNTGWQKRDFVATGCQLIDVGVFESMPYPWFEYWHKPFGPKKEISKWSEDAVFGKKCYDLGVPHFVDSDVICGHIHTVIIKPISEKEYTVEGMSGMVYPEIGIAQ